jgi:transposase
MSCEVAERVKAALRPSKAEKRVVLRGQAALLMSQGVSIRDTAKMLGVNDRTVRRWRQRFLRTGDIVAALADAPRSGRPRALSQTQTPRESKPKPAVGRATSTSR